MSVLAMPKAPQPATGGVLVVGVVWAWDALLTPIIFHYTAVPLPALPAEVAGALAYLLAARWVTST